MKRSFLILLTLALLPAANLSVLRAQAADEVLREGTINSQLQYIEQRTRIYENYRAIREDMFQDLSRNVRDSLSGLKSSLNTITTGNSKLKETVDSLTVALEESQSQLEEMTRTKNSLKFLGINIRKTAYNIIMWALVLILAGIMAAGFKSFKNNRNNATSLTAELENLKTEYEEYRKKARQEREIMSTEHFNELKRLRGK